jgi:hypothetical protein
MDHSNRNRTPAELQEIEDALRAERHQASPLELDRIKLQAIRQAERPRTSLYGKKGSFMKSRLALTLVLAAGFMLSTTGATLAISGSSGSGSAASNQYVPPGSGNEGVHKHHHPEQGVKGANEHGGKCTEGENGGGGNGGNSGGGAGGNGGNSGANGGGGNGCNEPANTDTLEPSPEVEVAPATAEQAAVVSSGSSLPFTGFVAIPLLIIGLALIVGGAVLGIKARKDPVARP